MVPNMIVRAGKERLAPVLMTCLTTGHWTGTAGNGCGRNRQGNSLSGRHRHYRRTNYQHDA